MKKIELNDELFGGHRNAKFLEFKLPLDFRRRSTFYLTYYNQGTEKIGTDKIERTPRVVEVSEDHVEFFILCSGTKLYFTLQRNEFIDSK